MHNCEGIYQSLCDRDAIVGTDVFTWDPDSGSAASFTQQQLDYRDPSGQCKVIQR